MTGFTITPGVIINQIKSLLKERYKEGFPIIKEIIQNANDGKATQLDFGLVGGLGNSVSHPLLKCPAIFFLNDGTFTPSDAKAIGYIGVDANAGNKEKIGKFGLGQKSVFHFCEAFFFIARSQIIPEGCGRFLNPWSEETGDKKRPEWIELSEQDRLNLEKYLKEQKLIIENSDYFILWIPLRQPTEDNRCILANYYNLNSIQTQFPDNMEDKIASLLPMLRHLRAVRYWIPNGTNLQKKFAIQVNQEGLQRCQYPSQTANYNQSVTNKLQGLVSFNNPNKQLKFAGQEAIISSSEFQHLITYQDSSNFWDKLQNSPYWSKRSAIDDHGDDKIVPDKSVPHCAVIFTQKNKQNQSAKLTIQWAVFLPLAESLDKEIEEFESIDSQSNYDYSVTLHGYFFLDSGRNNIDSLGAIRTGLLPHKTPTKEEEMIQQWNKTLATKGTLKQVLPSLKYFAEYHQLNAKEIYYLCDGLRKSRLFKSNIYRQNICEQTEWIYCLTPQGNKWQLLNKGAKVLSLPNTQNINLWSVFSHLKNLIDKSYCLLTLDNLPNLRYEGNSSDKWSKQEIKWFLDNLNIQKVFTDICAIKYLNSFLKENYDTNEGNEEVEQSLIKTLRGILTDFPFNQFTEEKIQAIKELIEFIDHQKLILLNCPEYMLKELSKNQEINALLLPAKFNISSHCNSLEYQDSLNILSAIQEWINITKFSQENILNLLIQILNLSENNLLPLLSNNPNLLCLAAQEYFSNNLNFYSYNQFKRFKSESRLFKSKNDNLRALVNAIQDLKPIIVEKEFGNLLEQIKDINPIFCNINTCREILRATPPLADASQRIKLLINLL
ncbi:sacsin N-terminal ATP-binding-like domain-containing protein [Geminocystis sp. GBBB08]|uniref:sacsin N-terminal ATP-binding-like domain-containing protein n=1 Tax=Geminocystis sp. GBBB08 TaxID=2604140 RepID=UPI0027E30893|nr:hypothetical protein [Geminocystis sp. GBBB08]MBL1208878.1 hypothetical protein [Geminocystis sp. GBBB08]